MNKDTDDPGRAAQPSWTPAAPVPEIASTDLFAQGSEVVILHAGKRYRLRITRQNKLILNT